MSCLLCGSGHQAEFSAEMMIHFMGLNHLDKPGVWLFPNLLVCLDCGSSRFNVPDKELALLASGALTSKGVTARLQPVLSFRPDPARSQNSRRLDTIPESQERQMCDVVNSSSLPKEL
jgi:hypothetical protein